MNFTFLGMDPTHLICSLALVYGAVEDLRTKKIKNSTNIAIFCIGLLISLSPLSSTGFFDALTAIGFAIAIMLPLFFLRVLGGGDVKLFVAVSPLITTSGILYSWCAAMIWGVLFGLTLTILNGRFKMFITNMKMISMKIRPVESSLQKIPFSIALVCGFFSFLIGKGVWL